jgi:hypothetical protein
MFLAGSTIGFEVPGYGVFYPPNLTPDARAHFPKSESAGIPEERDL